MDYEKSYCHNKLKDELYQRQKSNHGYSQRAFARDLKVHPATMALILKGQRPVPKKNIDFIVNYLELTPTEEAIFKETAISKKNKEADGFTSDEYLNRYIVDESHYKVIAEWEHYAVLTLLETDDFSANKQNISKRLNLPRARVEAVVKNLLLAELIKENDEIYTLTKGPLRTTEDIESKALRVSHKETLDMGKQKIDDCDVLSRDFSSITVAVNPENIKEAKKLIRSFRKKLASVLKVGKKTEVYQIAIQLFPLTDNNQENQ